MLCDKSDEKTDPNYELKTTVKDMEPVSVEEIEDTVPCRVTPPEKMN